MNDDAGDASYGYGNATGVHDTSGLRDWFVVYLKGIAMGAADAVPGVSGGTIALITGIYERLIGAVTAIDPRQVKRLLVALVRNHRGTAASVFDEMDGTFLVVLVSGVFTAIVVVTRLIDVALEQIPVVTFGFFFGLIGASAVVLYGSVALNTAGRVAAALVGFLLAFVVSGQAAANLGSGTLVVFGAGAIAVSAMILPGISGSLLLIILGQYEYMVGTLSAFVNGVLAVPTGGDVGALVGPGTVVVAFMLGAVVGLFTIAHVVRAALDAYREASLAFLISLIVGALRAPVVKVGEELAARGESWTPEVAGVFLGMAVLGAALVLVVDYYAGVPDY